jgi:hypothetical protein
VATRQVRKRRYTNTIHRKVYCMSSRIPRQQLGRPSTPGAHRQPDRIARSDRHRPPGHGLALTSQKNGPSSRPATIALPWCRSANGWTWSDLQVWSHSDPPRTNVRPGGVPRPPTHRHIYLRRFSIKPRPRHIFVFSQVKWPPRPFLSDPPGAYRDRHTVRLPPPYLHKCGRVRQSAAQAAAAVAGQVPDELL